MTTSQPSHDGSTTTEYESNPSTTPVEGPSCGSCLHPLSWHGDRAVVACDAGYLPRKAGLFQAFRVSMCSCAGWVPDYS